MAAACAFHRTFRKFISYTKKKVGHGQEVVLADLVERINALENQGKLQAVVLAAQEKRHGKDMAEQRKLVLELQSLLAAQNERIVALEAELQMIKADDVDEGKEKNDIDEGRIVERSEAPAINRLRSGASIRSSRSPAGEAVAFHARMSNDSVSHIGNGQKIVFDSVVLNLGNGYDSHRGLFVAPQAGIYIFSTSIMSYYKPHNQIGVGILKNGHGIGAAFAYGDASRDQGSVTVVLQLAVGDEIWVQNGGVSDASLWGQGFSSFMGCLVMFL